MMRTITAALVLLSGFGGGQLAAQSSAAAPTDLYKKAAPAVVLIELYNDNGEVSKTGSGFLVSADGKIVTNYHVVGHSKRATVRLANKDAYDDVQVLDVDKRKDIALVKIKAVDLPYLTLGHSNAVEIGDKVLTLSNPLGVLDNTLSDGIVSGIRDADGYHYFQMSAPISHGSSGAPVFNAKGEVIGIAAASIEQGQNLNFAIPIDYAKGMLASSNQPRSLASIYEPEADRPAQARASLSATSAVIPEGMKRGVLVYLQTKLSTWTIADANHDLGDSISYREGKPPLVVDIYGYADPTRTFRKVDLMFDKKSKHLIGIYGYPFAMNWEQCERAWGHNITKTKMADGGKVYTYKDRRLSVVLDKRDDVLSLFIF